MRLPILNCRLPLERPAQGALSNDSETEGAGDSKNRQLANGNRQCLS